jgi:hypothetical protein
MIVWSLALGVLSWDVVFFELSKKSVKILRWRVHWSHFSANSNRTRGAVMIDQVMNDLAEIRLEVASHPLFFVEWDQASLRRVMEHHVVAVWDFMSLVKTLQKGVMSHEVPWLPPSDPMMARAINQLVLAEESDFIESLGFTGSHFELYLSAMDEVGANTDPMERFLAQLATGIPFAIALESSKLPATAQRFARHTMHMCQRSVHEVAASFLFGREDVIPEMFNRFLTRLPDDQYPFLRAYLGRHTQVDEAEHLQLARQILTQLCGASERRWQEASDAAASSLAARRRLWDDVLASLELPQSSIPGQEQQDIKPSRAGLFLSFAESSLSRT